MGWTVFFIVIALLCLLLLLPVRVQFAVRGKKNWHLKVYYACFPVYATGSEAIANGKDETSVAEADGLEDADDIIDEEELLFMGSGEAPPVTRDVPQIKQPEYRQPAIEKQEPLTEETDSGASPDAEEKPKKKSLIDRVKPSNLSEALELVNDALASLSPPMRFLFRHLYLRKLNVAMTIGSGDAAKTAILYGAVSGAVFRLLGQLQCLISVKAEAIRIRADFFNEYSTAQCSGELRVSPMTALSLGFGIAIPFLWRTLLRLRRQDKLQKLEEKESAPLPAAQ